MNQHNAPSKHAMSPTLDHTKQFLKDFTIDICLPALKFTSKTPCLSLKIVGTIFRVKNSSFMATKCALNGWTISSIHSFPNFISSDNMAQQIITLLTILRQKIPALPWHFIFDIHSRNFLGHNFVSNWTWYFSKFRESVVIVNHLRSLIFVLQRCPLHPLLKIYTHIFPQ